MSSSNRVSEQFDEIRTLIVQLRAAEYKAALHQRDRDTEVWERKVKLSNDIADGLMTKLHELEQAVDS